MNCPFPTLIIEETRPLPAIRLGYRRLGYRRLG